LLAGVALLVLALTLQIILAKRDALAENPNWRPYISRLCAVTGCRLQSWRQPQAFIPIQNSVAADPKQAGALLVQLSFQNTAEWPQPWPQIEITLTDVAGEALAMRRFRPKDYLNDGQAGEIKPKQTVSVEIALQETTAKAAGFSFDFH
jgi:hypothetical protein